MNAIQKNPYYPQLDGVRGVAVGLVFLQHFAPPRMRFGLDTGTIGVWLFFVLSGFLITGILIHARKLIDTGGQTFWFTWRQFYIRRSLRIFPLFYGWTLSLAVFGLFSFSDSLIPHLTYTTNLVNSFNDANIGGVSSHYWSLAVEEQFYLVWPLIILLVPPRFLGTWILASILLGTTSRLGFAASGAGWIPCKQFTLNCLEPLALGGLLSWYADRYSLEGKSADCVRRGLFWVSLPMLLVGIAIYTSSGRESFYSRSLLLSTISLFSLWIVWTSAVGFGGVTGKILMFSPIACLGKISYGLYVVHPFVGYWVEYDFGFIDAKGGWNLIGFLIKVGMSIAIASASWWFVESRFNDLKKLFPMSRKPTLSMEQEAESSTS